MSHVYKGFGIEAEKPEIELAKKLSPLLHENGIKMEPMLAAQSAMKHYYLRSLKQKNGWCPIILENLSPTEINIIEDVHILVIRDTGNILNRF